MPLLVLEAALVIAWSSGFVGARFSVDHAPVLLVVFWRCLVVMLVLLPWVVRDLLRTPVAVLWRHIGIGLLAMTGYLTGVVKGIEYGVPAGLAALIADLLPIGCALLATLLGQRPAVGVWCGLGIGLGGVMLVTHGALAGGHTPWWAYGLPLLGMLSLAVATLWQKRAAHTDQMPLAANLWLQCAVSAVAFALMAGSEGSLMPIPSAGFAVSVIWTAVLSSIGGYGLYWLCLQRSSPTRVASVLYLSPALTLVWAWMMFDEPLSWTMLLGTAISGWGVWMVMRHDTPRRR